VGEVNYMRRVNEITIDADVATIYALAADVERWPALLPHYRAVQVLWREDDGRRLVARMAATRSGIPVRWTCWLERDPAEPRLTFRHIGGFTRGMQVAWTFEPLTDGRVTVRITHVFSKGWPGAVLDQVVSDTIVGAFFVHAIASRTLAMVRLLAESEHAVHTQLAAERAQEPVSAAATATAVGAS
jgi:ribosome-associated toxin RatA of RatAB toxin-antitoxin module